MGNAQPSNGLVATESKLSLVRRRVTTLDMRSSKRSSASERWRANDTTASTKRFTKLGSIRRKLVRRTRKGSSDYRKHIRELLQSWSIKEIQSFIREYDTLDALRDLHRLSDNARIRSPRLKSDMANLYENQLCCDLEIEFRDTTFHVHRALLCARCNLFTIYLAASKSKTYIKIKTEDFDYSTSIFSSLLRYIYSGYTKDRQLKDTLASLAQKFGVLNPLDDSMKEILTDDASADLILAFSNTTHTIHGLEAPVDNTLEVFCHSAILCARSQFFRSLLVDKFKDRHVNNTNGNVQRMRLVLSENIIPRTYIKVILHCMYTDCLDLSCVIKWKVADDGSGEADRLLTPVELGMELYEIGHFLEFPYLMEQCEDMILEHLNVTTLLPVWEWSSQPCGSNFVNRQATCYFSEEFISLCKTPVFLANVPKKFLMSVVRSDFLQANEEFILGTVIRWGEWQIAKANEKPGSSPANSLPRRSPKRRDINNNQLRDLISELLQHVRLRHVIPTSSPVLQSAHTRGLVQHPFPFDFESSEKRGPYMMFWLQEFRHSDYMRPRFFSPYVDEVKLVLLERQTAESSSSSSSSVPAQCMPDMLTCNYPTGERVDRKSQVLRDSFSSCIMDINDLGPTLMRKMILREKELKTSAEVLRALKISPDNAEIGEETKLRVVREFGLPDDLSSVIFKQNPDLIEFDSSSGSSKQSTLSKVGLLMSCEQPSSTRTSLYAYDNPVLMHTPPHDRDSSKLTECDRDDLQQPQQSAVRSGLTLDLQPQGMTDIDLRGVGGAQGYGIPRSIEDSPLDLPPRDGILSTSSDSRLPNVLLDT